MTRCHAVFPAESERGRADRAGTKDADRFEMMNRHGKLHQFFDLDAQGEMIAADVTARRDQIERVLVNVRHGLVDLRFEI